ncbi:hypothetical protein PUW24_18785 [Paenibacillus urinalis]|uniref:Uncharacterized protein n=1 Tax=Paenibacillus urinalis TaxID=521520 RepID=A0ABY7XF56_9BACL|nr:hypothetical protein [Paenibacillus urinalis]WDH96208.1 hypothetical protein PUW24_18785 [Paenibacillus urinalis]WDI04431.1 hypothetical protein PUW25_10950 [Paenibacillus urinalis]
MNDYTQHKLHEYQQQIWEHEDRLGILRAYSSSRAKRRMLHNAQFRFFNRSLLYGFFRKRRSR